MGWNLKQILKIYLFFPIPSEGYFPYLPYEMLDEAGLKDDGNKLLGAIHSYGSIRGFK
jgi:hypothetical protein